MIRVICRRPLPYLFCGLIILGFIQGSAVTAFAQFSSRVHQGCLQEYSNDIDEPELPSRPIAIANEPIVITDEPSLVDPIQFMPPEVTANATVNFENEPLHAVVDWIRREYSVDVVVDNKALVEESISIDTPITDHLKNEPLFLLLDRLHASRLEWYVHDHVIHITMIIGAEHIYYGRSYYVGDLLKMGCTCHSLLQTITRTINDHWFGTADASTKLLGDVLLVRAKRRTHLEINGLLAAIRKPGRRTFIGEPIQNEMIRKKLDEPAVTTVLNSSLRDTINELAKTTDTDIRIDVLALEEEQISDRISVSGSPNIRPLRQVLHVTLSNKNLTWLIENGVLWITTLTEAHKNWKLAVFDVRDLCRDPEESEDLIEAIKHQTSSGWDRQEGESGEIIYPLPGILVVRYSDQILNEISDLLKEYRKALESSPPPLKRKYDPTEFLTRYYRLQTDLAIDLKQHLPELVQPSSWKSSTNSGAQGTIRLLTSFTDVEQSGNQGPQQPKKADRPAISMSVLIIQQTRQNHREIERTIDKVGRGDPSDRRRGMGRGTGFFQIPENR